MKFYSQEQGDLLRSIAEWVEENRIVIDNLVWRLDFAPIDPTRNLPDDDIMPVFTVFLYYTEIELIDPDDPGPVRYPP